MLLGPLLPHSGTFTLPSSKSLANRVLIIQALAAEPHTLHINKFGDAEDVQTMQRLLSQVADGAILDCGAAGTTFRFLTAYLATQPGHQTLTGSARMLERPIGPLIGALEVIGAYVEYLGKPGYPPLRIGPSPLTLNSAVTLAGDISSQFLSALLLIAPALPDGLTLNWTGKLVSRPYLDMTCALMQRFGASLTVNEQQVKVEPEGYAGGSYTVEADWSAASYAAAWAALLPLEQELVCPDLHGDSLQGDRRVCDWIAEWGVVCSFDESGVRFRKTQNITPSTFEADFNENPDLAQTFAILCAVTGTTGLFSGLETLKIKETDRIAALQQELQKVGVFLTKLPPRFAGSDDMTYYMQEGEAQWEGTVSVATYNDHRMAMAFSLLAARGAVEIGQAEVVTKSFPSFWEALAAITRPAT